MAKKQELELTEAQKELIYFMKEHKRLRNLKITQLSHLNSQIKNLEKMREAVLQNIDSHEAKISSYSKQLQREAQ